MMRMMRRDFGEDDTGMRNFRVDAGLQGLSLRMRRQYASRLADHHRWNAPFLSFLGKVLGMETFRPMLSRLLAPYGTLFLPESGRNGKNWKRERMGMRTTMDA